MSTASNAGTITISNTGAEARLLFSFTSGRVMKWKGSLVIMRVKES
jgi:hypothetical protein